MKAPSRLAMTFAWDVMLHVLPNEYFGPDMRERIATKFDEYAEAIRAGSANETHDNTVEGAPI